MMQPPPSAYGHMKPKELEAQLAPLQHDIEAMEKAGLRVPFIWRGFGWKDGSEDIERFRRALFDGEVKVSPSLLLRSAFSDAIVIHDPNGNQKLAKGRSLGRIDAAAAALVAVAQGQRMKAAPARKARLAWV